MKMKILNAKSEYKIASNLENTVNKNNCFGKIVYEAW